MLEEADCQVPSFELVSAACAPLGAEKKQFVCRKISFFQDFEEFLPDRAAGTNNSYFHILTFV